MTTNIFKQEMIDWIKTRDDFPVKSLKMIKEMEIDDETAIDNLMIQAGYEEICGSYTKDKNKLEDYFLYDRFNDYYNLSIDYDCADLYVHTTDKNYIKTWLDELCETEEELNYIKSNNYIIENTNDLKLYENKNIYDKNSMLSLMVEDIEILNKKTKCNLCLNLKKELVLVTSKDFEENYK